MNIKKAKDEIKNTVRAYLKKDADGEYIIPAIRQRPILLIGPPGVGKVQMNLLGSQNVWNLQQESLKILMFMR